MQEQGFHRSWILSTFNSPFSIHNWSICARRECLNASKAGTKDILSFFIQHIYQLPNVADFPFENTLKRRHRFLSLNGGDVVLCPTGVLLVLWRRSRDTLAHPAPYFLTLGPHRANSNPIVRRAGSPALKFLILLIKKGTFKKTQCCRISDNGSGH